MEIESKTERSWDWEQNTGVEIWEWKTEEWMLKAKDKRIRDWEWNSKSGDWKWKPEEWRVKVKARRVESESERQKSGEWKWKPERIGDSLSGDSNAIARLVRGGKEWQTEIEALSSQTHRKLSRTTTTVPVELSRLCNHRVSLQAWLMSGPLQLCHTSNNALPSGYLIVSPTTQSAQVSGQGSILNRLIIDCARNTCIAQL